MLFREIRTIRMGSRVGTDILSVREVSSDLGGAPSYGFAITLLSLRDISPIRGIFADPYGDCVSPLGCVDDAFRKILHCVK